MALTTPTTQELADTIVSQIEASISQIIPLLPKAFTRVLGKVLAAVVVLVYRYAGWSHLQTFVQHASFEPTEVLGKTIRPLVEWGRTFGVGDPNEATRAELIIDVTVTEQTGTLPANSQLVRAETGVVYLTTEPVVLDAATVSVTIRASGDPDGNGGGGTIGNLEPGDIVTFANPLPNIASDAVVASLIEVGAAAEEAEDYRTRVLRRAQRKPQGGAYADYQLWAEDVEGVENAYPYTSDDPGEVDVYVEAEPDLEPDGIADATLRAAVDEAIQFDDDDSGRATRRPANAFVNVLSISRLAFDVTVSNLDPDDSATREQIEAAVDEHLRSREPFITGLSTLPRQDRITQGAIAGAVNEVAAAEGATVSDVALVLDDNEITAYTLAKGEKAKLGTMTFE